MLPLVVQNEAVFATLVCNMIKTNDISIDRGYVDMMLCYIQFLFKFPRDFLVSLGQIQSSDPRKLQVS